MADKYAAYRAAERATFFCEEDRLHWRLRGIPSEVAGLLGAAAIRAGVGLASAARPAGDGARGDCETASGLPMIPRAPWR